MVLSRNSIDQATNIQRYYQLQSQFYDATRWTFLFGRKRLIKHLPFYRTDQFRVLEIGCGTGQVLYHVASSYPHANINGLDISSNMLNIAAKKLEPFRNRVALHNNSFSAHWQPDQRFDLIIFAYTLTMLNPNWVDFLRLAQTYLTPNGKIAVVDFHDTHSQAYKSFMAYNHVNLNGHILPYLEKTFYPLHQKTAPGILGIWHYFTFIGKVNDEGFN